MDIRNRKGLRRAAADAVAANTGDPRYTLLIYIAVTALSGLFVTALTMMLDQKIAGTGGLQNLGSQATLSTIRSAAPLMLSLALLGLDLGRRAVALKIARRQSVETKDLLLGFPHFGAMLRAMFLHGALYLLLVIVAVNVGSIIFLATPLAKDLYAIVLDLSMSTDELYNALYNDPAFLEQVFRALLPAYPIALAIFALAAAPIFYRFRMTNFCLLEGYRKGALAATVESFRMTRGKGFALFKLDLSYWWFYLGQMVCAAVMYGDQILPGMGISLPWNETVSYFVFYIAALALEAVLYWFTLNNVQTTYAMAYEALRPQPQPTQGGVVLGNIFDLARDQKEK